jgi:hypothetical protein
MQVVSRGLEVDVGETGLLGCISTPAAERRGCICISYMGDDI